MKLNTFISLCMFYFAGAATGGAVVAFSNNDAPFFWFYFFLTVGAVVAGFAGLPRHWYEAKEEAAK